MDLNLLDKELRLDEGVKYSSYLDTKGIPTTGVGHNLKASPLPIGWKFPLNDNQVNQLLNHDLTIAFAGLDLHFPWWRKLSEVRQRVIANMCFNLGIERLMEFVNTLKAMESGSYAQAASGMLASAWASQVGERAKRLAKAMETDVMPAH